MQENKILDIIDNERLLVEKKGEKGSLPLPTVQPVEIKQQREKVKHSRFGEGEIISIKGDKIKVVFGGINVKIFPYPSSINDGTLKLVNSAPAIPNPKASINNKRNVFFCFQGKQYENEVEGGYIFAGANHNISHWDRLREVKVGDVVFHCYRQYIVALSIVTRECRIEKRPLEHYLVSDIPDMEGYMVKMKYIQLQRPLATFRYKREIKQMQGDHIGKGYPFNKNGEGNQGYLYNLNRKLADFFMQEILKQNSYLEASADIQRILKREPIIEKKLTKICPKCCLNWIEDDKKYCNICEKFYI